MKHEAILATVALALFPALAAGAPAGQAAARRPNILFILADDWGWGDFSLQGNEKARTPHLDQLAAAGTRFTQFRVSNPVCSPSRTAFLTGRFPARFAIHQHFDTVAGNTRMEQPDWLDPQTVLLTRLLQESGYVIGHFGKWHLSQAGVRDAPLPPAYGIDEHAVWTAPRGSKQTDHRKVFDDTIAFLRTHRERPFFVNLWIKETHAAQEPSAESMRELAHLDDQHRPYYAAVSDGDKGIGRVLAVLRELKLEENTIVIFTSDNGPERTGSEAQKELRGGYGLYYSVGSAGGQRGRKRSLFDGGVRLPFFVRWPGRVPAGRENHRTVLSAVDLLPTLCAAAGVTLPADHEFDGENMLPAWLGAEPLRTKPIYWEWRGLDGQPDTWPRHAVQSGEWKLVVGREGRRELFRPAEDPGERNDLARAHPEVVASLGAQLEAWIATLPTEPAAHCLSRERQRPSPAQPARP